MGKGKPSNARFTVYVCRNTNCQRMFQKPLAYCPRCGTPKPLPIIIGVKQYCEQFGHASAEMLVPGTEKKEWGGLESHEFRFLCVRCGLQRTTRKTIDLIHGEAIRLKR